MTDYTFLGARIGFAMAVPYLANGRVGGSGTTPLLPGFGVYKAGDVRGFGDMFFIPLQFNWVAGDQHFTFAPGFTAPTGKYDIERLLNVGRNYWSFDIAGSYTWFDPKLGIDVSFTTGILLNSENPATNYHTGSEFHFDGLVAQFFSERFALGAAGYFYRQIGGDSGTIAGGLVDVSNFRGQGTGLGPAALIVILTGGPPLTIIGKALFDIDNQKRFRGDLYMLSVAFKLF